MEPVPNATAKEVELKIVPSVEMQLKLKKFLKAEDKANQVVTILAICEMANAEATNRQDFVLIDEYYDTPEFSLFLSSDSCRIRRKGNDISLNIKRPISISEGKFERAESTFDLSAREIKLFEGSGILPEKVFLEIPNFLKTPLIPRLKITNLRTTFDIEQIDAKFELALDVFTFQRIDYPEEKSSKEFFEIELEAKNEAACNKISTIKHGILALDGNIVESTRSKYQTGVEFFRLNNDNAFWAMVRRFGNSGWKTFVFGTILALVLFGVGLLITLVGKK